MFLIKYANGKFEENCLADLKFLINEYQLHETDFAIVFNNFTSRKKVADDEDKSSRCDFTDIMKDMSLNIDAQYKFLVD